MRLSKTIVCEDRFVGLRIDSYLASVLRLFPRSQARSRVTEIMVNGRPAKLATRLDRGDHVTVSYRDPEPLHAEPESMALSILYEDSDAIVLDKPAGVVTHPGAGNRTGTLLNGVLGYCARLRDAFPDDPVRPGVVHRLDKETSGVIIFAKSPQAHHALSRQFALRYVQKRYLAVLDGLPPETEGTVELPIGRDERDRIRFAVVGRGREAFTSYRLLAELTRARSLVMLAPITGRTHQLRVHMAAIGCPVTGDAVYGSRKRLAVQAMLLHASSLQLRLPRGITSQRFRAGLPAHFRKEPGVVDCLRGLSSSGEC